MMGKCSYQTHSLNIMKALTFIAFYVWFTAFLPVYSAESALSFTGSSSYVNIGTPDVLQIPSNDPFTVEGWMLFNALSNRDMLYCKNNAHSGSPYTYMLGFADHKLAAYNSAWRGSFAVSRELGRWYHVAFSFDGSTMFFYLDGQLLGTAGFSFVNTATHAVKIGGYDSSSDINGRMNDVRVWNYARSNMEILNRMNYRLTGDESGLIGYWPLNDGTGSTAFDKTANASDGSIINASWVLDEDLSLLSDFTLANPVTGNTRFTNTNRVDVLTLVGPEGYTDYQITEDGAPPIDEAWIPTNTPPVTVEFAMPGGDEEISLTAWFTNTSSSVELHSFTGNIFFTTALPEPAIRAEYSRVFAAGQVEVFPAELDIGSTGGEAGGEAIPVYFSSLTLLSGPDSDATPDDPWITVSSQGLYTVEMVVMNAVGNIATSSVCQLELLGFDGSADTFYVDNSWTGAESGTETEPFKTIKAAVDAVNLAATEPKTIRIAEGWYGDVANGGAEDYSQGGGDGGGIYVTRRTEFYGGYAGWQGGANFDWETRTPRATVIDLENAESRAFHVNRSAQSRIVGIFDGFTFQNADHTGNGGAIMAVSALYGRFLFNDCMFSNNFTTGEGGAIYIDVPYEPHTVTSCDFIDNSGSNGGAIRSGNNTVRMTLEDCIFLRNNASAAGGAIYFDGSNGWQQNVRRSYFEGNTAGTRGGALYSSDPRVVIEQSSFISNAAPQGAALGGNNYWCGAFYLQNCLVAGNTGGYALQVEGHRLFSTYCLDVVHCTVIDNPGGGIRFRGNTTNRPGRVVNSIVANNGEYGIYHVANGYVLANNNIYSNATDNYYNCEPDENSISEDALFADTNDFRLQKDSPCIDAAIDIQVFTDLNNVIRPIRHGYDIGCYEEWQIPFIVNHIPTVEGDSALLRAEFTYESPEIDTFAYFVLDTSDKGTNSITDWQFSERVGEYEEGIIFEHLFEGLLPNTVYWFRCMSSNSYDIWWGPPDSFKTPAGGGSTRVWTGAGADELASNPDNWLASILPSEGDYILLNDSSKNMTWDAGVGGLPHTVERWTQQESYTGIVTFATVYPGQGDFTNFIITGDVILDNGTWTHMLNNTGQIYRLAVEVAGDMVLASSNAAVGTTGLGYYGAGPGVPPVDPHYMGAAHGGRGGGNAGSTNVYGSMCEPIDLGSGGGYPKSRGGGAIRLIVRGALIHNGRIAANSAHINSTGGSVYITAGEFRGEGTVEATNPSSTSTAYMSAGGGRIAVILTRTGADFSDFSGIILANTVHANTTQRGAAGTVYLETPDQGRQQGTLIIDNGNQVPTHFTTLSPDDELNKTFSMLIQPTGRLMMNRNIKQNNLTIAAGAELDLNGHTIIVGNNLTVADVENYAKGTYTADDFGPEVIDTADPANGRIILPNIGTVLRMR